MFRITGLKVGVMVMARVTEVGVPLAAELACNSGRRSGGNSAIKCFSFWQKCSKS